MSGEVGEGMGLWEMAGEGRQGPEMGLEVGVRYVCRWRNQVVGIGVLMSCQ